MLANRLRILLALTVTAFGVSAQSGLSDCAVSCLKGAEGPSPSCISYTDVSCVCNSGTFQTAATNCLNAYCTTQDYQTATQLQAEHCH
ncbi:hypothetical protein BJV78DRAFT_1221352 [Lactifluus subvellereus]|nr:hypothetical protein BJV78DRAFT_1221352 [Lactifluus subvellereus]